MVGEVSCQDRIRLLDVLCVFCSHISWQFRSKHEVNMIGMPSHLAGCRVCSEISRP